MPAQKCITIDGTQVLWKHYRKKQGTSDVVKFCFGRVLPEKQWKSHHIDHDVVNACSTNTALAAAVRSLAAEIMNVSIQPAKDTGCCECKGHETPKQPAAAPAAPAAPILPDISEPDAAPSLSTESAERRLARTLLALSRTVEPLVQLAFAGELGEADASRLKSGAVLDDLSTTDSDDGRLVAESLAEDRARSETVRQQLEVGDWPPAYSEAYCRRTLSLLRDVYMQRASYALLTAEWQTSLAHFLKARLGATRILEVCCGRNLLTTPMRKLGLEWVASDERLPPPFDRAADNSGPAAAALDAAMVDALRSSGLPAADYTMCSEATIEVGGALDVARRRLAAGDVDAVFYSWWPPDDMNHEDHSLAVACMEAGVPLVFVGEPRGGCTGSDKIWSGGFPIRRVSDMVDEAEVVDGVVEGGGWVDVAQWSGCSDVTWCIAA